MADADRLARLVETIADRRQVDWETVGAATPDDERAVTRALQWIDEIATFAESFSSGAATESAVRAPAETALGTWSHLRLLEQTGAGGFGTVYRAWDLRLDREVALKLLHPASAAHTPDDRLVEEARLLARVRHPNVVAVHGVDEIGGRAGFWMDFIEGKTLERVLHDVGPLGAHEATLIGVDLCRALAAIHAVGLLHRDVKTTNVMREDGGRIVLMDFGAGLPTPSASDEQTPLTGTPAYLAPEVVAGGRASIQSDVYSIGVLLYRLVTRAYPVTGSSIASLRHAHANRQRLHLRDVRPDLPPAFVQVVERALAETPGDRYTSAGALEADLLTTLDAARTGMPVERGSAPQRGRSRRRSLTLSVGAVALVAVGLVGWFDLGGLRSRWTSGPRVNLPGGPVRLPQQVMGRPSRDGRFFPYLDGIGVLHVWDAVTGQTRVVGPDRQPGAPAPFEAMAPAGDRIAYGWKLPDGAWELRVQDLDKPTPNALLTRQTAFQPIPVDWSRDGRSVLCWFRQRNGTEDLALVPTDGSLPRTLHTYPHGQVETRAALSPDGRLVAVPGSGDSRLAFLFTDGSGRVEATAIDAGRVAWAPNGQQVIFATAHENGVWQVGVLDGRATGAPQSLASVPAVTGAQDWVDLIGVTDQGDVMFERNNRLVEAYTASIDPAFDGLPGPPTQVQASRFGDHVGPSWSPDGRFLAYLDVVPDPRRIVIKDLTTGAERPVPSTLPFIGGRMPAWTADGQALIIFGSDAGSARNGLYRVSPTTGAATLVVIPNLAGPPVFQCMKDPDALLYLDVGRGLIQREFATGHETVLVAQSPANVIQLFAVAFDGRTIALQRRRVLSDKRVDTIEIRTANGTLHSILEHPAPGGWTLRAWTPAGDILFDRTEIASSGDRVRHLWALPSTGGAPHDVGFGAQFDGPNPIAVRPDGRQFAYTESKVECDLVVGRDLARPRR